MKRIYTLLLSFLALCAVYAQTDGEEGRRGEVKGTPFMGLIKDEAAYLGVHVRVMNRIGALMSSRMYAQAVEAIDSFRKESRDVWGREIPEYMLICRGDAMAHMDRWAETVETLDECLRLGNPKSDADLFFIYDLKGFAQVEMKEYRQAAKSYKSAMTYSMKRDVMGDVADACCNMAYCYMLMDRTLMAQTFYERGLDTFMDYFHTSYAYLLKHELQVSDRYRRRHKSKFADHLYGMALLEEKNGNRKAMRKYLRMSANCGSELAQREYRRLYGD